MENKFSVHKFGSNWTTRKRNKIQAKNKLAYATFQGALKTTLLIGQIFGLVPVAGVLDGNVKNINLGHVDSQPVQEWRIFKIQARRPKPKGSQTGMHRRCCDENLTQQAVYDYGVTTLKSALYLPNSVFMAFVSFMCFYRTLVTDGTMEASTFVIFYLSCAVTSTVYLYVANKWPELVRHIAATEDLDPITDTSLKFKCNVTCAVILITALIEHVLSLIAAFVKSLSCHPDEPWHRAFVESSYPFIFNYIPYSVTLGVIIQVIHFQSTFVWSYSDLFVICVSYYLTSRLDQINVRLRAAQGKVGSFVCVTLLSVQYLLDPFWRVTREDYSRAARLVRTVDAVIGGIVLICFFNNLFFICLQLFHILE
ncbi:Gustatory receptor for sugar taste 64e [Eumeta japonica]|uniref:Gustatory receptor for sugar taste 64e n=1 Tax=Eumeta variegata TaxID=151549 RepID=A0A4C1UJG3_EUMVA|nr:Gustatory receptor for sugar taste 64e [Eumeta japonica]